LPAVREAFAAGRLSYSKVRAITRIARPDTEQGLLELAMAGTTSHVERAVRAARQQSADPVVSHARRTLSWHWDADGMLVLRGRLTAAEGAAVVAAIEACIDGPKSTEPKSTEPKSTEPKSTEPESSEREPTPRGPTAEAVDPVGARRADALHTLAVAGASGQRTRVVLHVNGATQAATRTGAASAFS
jgi:hypothetical protein